jgi:ketosteroid isomerase-like protein
MELKEKTMYLYIGEDIENSFKFWVSKIHNNDVTIVVNYGTPEARVFKLNKGKFTRIKELKG